jgi:DNA polymerase I-like protein with 3'-5' exonuclease and polymerase domains
MRIMAHLSEDQGLIEAFRSGEDFHTVTAARVFATDPAQITPDMRSRIKAMNYGLAYGLSSYGLSQQLGIDTSAAQALMNEYFERFGGVRDYLAGIVGEARRTGFTETIMGRRRYLPDLTSDNRQRREMAERWRSTRRSRARPPTSSSRDARVARRLAEVRAGVADAAAGARRAGAGGGRGRARASRCART